MKETDIAYFAGFFDGEGCTNYYVRKATNGKEYFILTVRIFNTNKEPLLKCKEVFGYGSISTHNRYNKPKYQTCYNWNCSGKNAKHFLETVLPYLTVKKEHVKILLETGRYNYVGRGIKPAKIVNEEAIIKYQKCLNPE